jgi:hypothetical protein
MSGMQVWISGDDLKAIEFIELESAGKVALINLEDVLATVIAGTAMEDRHGTGMKLLRAALEKALRDIDRIVDEKG